MTHGAAWVKRIGWFVFLWIAGVGVTLTIAFGIRLWLSAS
ncbi:hypothetical protein QO005_003859 [Rhizobium paknamense]|jgi:hypothetical protein|uniref:DUF2474 domain-containing protein n=1 Tax=Rhizobium paknamense TaxID=1206817 RepID=A0ABU0IGV3_9HYPH|nr:hypothetical protein [Rhizobium paknamense]